MTELRQIVIVRNYDELQRAIRARADELKLSRESVDHLTGLQDGYTAKLLMPVPDKSFGRISLGPILQVMGLVLIVAEDRETLDKIKHRFVERNEKAVRAGHKRAGHKKRHKFPPGPEFAKLMRARQLLTQSDKQRKRIARIAAKVRWANKAQMPR